MPKYEATMYWTDKPHLDPKRRTFTGIGKGPYDDLDLLLRVVRFATNNPPRGKTLGHIIFYEMSGGNRKLIDRVDYLPR